MTSETVSPTEHEDLSCQELVELVTDYFEGRLPDSERGRFDDHLATCQGCTTYVEQMRLTIRALGRLPEESVAPDARERMLAAFRGWKRNAASITPDDPTAGRRDTGPSPRYPTR